MKPAILIAPFLLIGCTASEADTTDEGVVSRSPVAACVQRGVAYFKAIGSYPALKMAPNAGRSAEIVAVERCNRSADAF